MSIFRCNTLYVPIDLVLVSVMNLMLSVAIVVVTDDIYIYISPNMSHS